MRNIILLSTILIFLSCGTKPATDQCEKKCCKNTKKEISLQMYSLREDISKDYESTIKKIGEMGFTSVEAAGYNDGKFYGKTPAEFKRDIENAGMTVLSSHTGKKLSENELKTKDFSESLKWWEQCIQAHKETGAKYIVDPWLSVPQTIDELQTYCEYYNEVGKQCKENGLSFGYHNHAHEFQKVEDKVMLDYMIENTDPEYVFYQLDVYWAVMGHQSPVDYFHKYPGRFELLHIKDNKKLGQSGMVGFDAIFRNTDISGVKHLIVEVEKYNFAPEESVKQSLEYLLNCPFVKEKY